MFKSRTLLFLQESQTRMVSFVPFFYSQFIRNPHASRMQCCREANQRPYWLHSLRRSARSASQLHSSASRNRSRSLCFPQRNEPGFRREGTGIDVPYPAIRSDLSIDYRVFSRNESPSSRQARGQGVSVLAQSWNQQIRFHAQVDISFFNLTPRNSFLSYSLPSYSAFFSSQFNFVQSGSIFPLCLDRKTHVFTETSMEMIVWLGEPADFF